MKYFALENLTARSLSENLPWEFQTTANITDEIRKDKGLRQEFYKNPSVKHSFYTAVEPANPNQRASSTDNPPRLLHGIVADYDLPMTLEAVQKGIRRLPIKPSWIEESLGGNYRLVWEFPRPLPAESYDFCCALLLAALKWLKVDEMPGLDEPAFSDPTRLYCNGCKWTSTGAGPVPEDALQAFFVSAAKRFKFSTDDAVLIPLDAVRLALAEKFPNFCWESEFVPETNGPSFWIEGSLSSHSAILKPAGFYTFSAHADKVFYTWEDILGAEFVAQYTEAAISKATGDIWFDGRKFWRQKKGSYTAMEREELTNFLRVDCGIPTKDDQLAAALSHIYNENFVENASPYIFRPSGLLIYQGKRRLNTAKCALIQPATGQQVWGKSGGFPFLSSVIESIFTTRPQLDHFLAWFKYFYETGLNFCPAPGPAIFLMGGVGTGKTLLSREIVGRSVGGFADAASYLIRGSEFNSSMFEVPLWALDDDTVADSPAAAANVQAMLKKSVANNSFMVNKKFQNAGMVEWMGRIIATTNLDYVSSRMLGPLDNGSLDKISVFRCQTVSKIHFPPRHEVNRLVDLELPLFLRWLTDHTPPEHVERNNRFGYVTWQEPTLMDQAGQTSKSAPFKEILLETLEEFFHGSPEALEWRGTVSRLIQQLHANPAHECVIRTLRLEQVSRYLEAIDKAGDLGCRVETGEANTRLWIFPRLSHLKPTPPVPTPDLEAQQPGIFSK